MAGASIFFKAGGGRVACALLLLAAMALMGFAGSAANAQSKHDESFLAAKREGAVGHDLHSEPNGYSPISDDEREDELNAYDEDKAGEDGDFADDEDFEDDGQESLLENEGVARQEATSSHQQTMPYDTDYDTEDYDGEDGDEDYDDGPEAKANSFVETGASDNGEDDYDDGDAFDENPNDDLEEKDGEEKNYENNYENYENDEDHPAFLEDAEMDDDELDEDDRHNDMGDARDGSLDHEDVEDEKTEVPSMVDLEEDDDDVPMVEDQTGVERKLLSQVSNERPIHPHSMLDLHSATTSDKMMQPNQETIQIGVNEALHLNPSIPSHKLETKSNRQL